MKALLTALALTLAAAPAAAQMPAPAGPKAGESFAFLTGRWSGEGWIQMGPERHAFRQTERVAPMLDGSIMTIEGKGVDPADPKVVHHHAFAILSWNPEAQRYDFRSYAGGRAGRWRPVGPALRDGTVNIFITSYAVISMPDRNRRGAARRRRPSGGTLRRA